MSTPSIPRLVLALVAENGNGALDLGSSSLNAFFQGFGYEAQTLNIQKDENIQFLMQALQDKRVAFAYAYAGVGSHLLSYDKQSIWTKFQTPFLSIWYDHPCYQYRNHNVDSPFVFNLYHVKDHLAIAQKYLKNQKNAFYGGLMPCGAQAQAKPEWRDRERRFFFAKTGQNPDAYPLFWKENLNAYAPHLIEISEIAKVDPSFDLCRACEDLFIQKSWDIDNLDVFLGFVQEIDAFIRAWRSDRLAKSLLKYPTHIFGSGWEYLVTETNQDQFMPSFHAFSMAEKMSTYRLCANSSPLWRDGIHERAVIGLMSGCITVSDQNERSDRIFPLLSHYVSYNWMDDSTIDDALERAWNMSVDDQEPYENKSLSYQTEASTLFKDVIYTKTNFLIPLLEKFENVTGRVYPLRCEIMPPPKDTIETLAVNKLDIFYPAALAWTIRVANDFLETIQAFPKLHEIKNIFQWRAGPALIGYTLLANGIGKTLSLSDPSLSALDAAKMTAKENGLEGNIHFYNTDDIADLPQEEQFDLVVTLLPNYSKDNMQKHMFGSDPRNYLDRDWALRKDFYKKIAERLTLNGHVILFEASYGSEPNEFVQMIDDAGLEFVGWQWAKTYDKCFWYQVLCRKDSSFKLAMPPRR